jgi:hypothetical protein
MTSVQTADGVLRRIQRLLLRSSMVNYYSIRTSEVAGIASNERSSADE